MSTSFDHTSRDSAIHELDRLGVKYKSVEQPKNIDELQSLVKKAAQQKLKLFPIGGGTSLGMVNMPDMIDILLDMKGLQEIVHFDSKNLNIIVQSGLIIDKIRLFLSNQGRGYTLPLDPIFSSSATIGGAYAANSSGPLRHFYGTLRDQALGASAIDALGRRVKFGGVTVKNVSGYDLTKFFIGSCGSLCIIDQIALRILPFSQSFSACEITFSTLDQAANFLNSLQQSVLIPSGVVLYQQTQNDTPKIIVAFEGHEKAVTRQNIDISQMSEKYGGSCDTHMGRESMIEGLQKAFDPNPGCDPNAIFKISVPIGLGTETFNKIYKLAKEKNLDAKCTLLAGNGVIHIHIMSENESVIASYSQDLKKIIQNDKSHFIPIKASQEIARKFISHHDNKTDNYLLKPLKEKFDPYNILPEIQQ